MCTVLKNVGPKKETGVLDWHSDCCVPVTGTGCSLHCSLGISLMLVVALPFPEASGQVCTYIPDANGGHGSGSNELYRDVNGISGSSPCENL